MKCSLKFYLGDMNLLEVIRQAEKQKIAIGHFNVSNFEMLKAVSNVAAKFGLPIIVGVSEGEREYLGIHYIVDMVQSCNKEHEKKRGYRLFLNADHTRSLDKLKEVVEAGYDSLVFDAAELSFEENVKKTQEAVRAAKAINPDVIVEGELGYIGKSSKLLRELPKDAAIETENLPTAEQALRFVGETGVDMLAPAVGNIHGMFKDAPNPKLNIERIRQIKDAVKVPLVLHGGSGIRDEEFTAAIDASISIVHISTELRVAWRKAFEQSLLAQPDEIAPYRIGKPVVDALEELIERRVKLFTKL